MIRLSVVAATLVVAASVPAGGDTTLECSAQVSTQVEVASCVEAQLRIVNLALEDALGFARDAATELDSVTERNSATPALQEAQDTWTAYRDAQCSYSAALFGGGSGAGIAEDACRVTLTRQRIAELMASVQ